jgi:hypothetical protein
MTSGSGMEEGLGTESTYFAKIAYCSPMSSSTSMKICFPLSMQRIAGCSEALRCHGVTVHCLLCVALLIRLNSKTSYTYTFCVCHMISVVFEFQTDDGELSSFGSPTWVEYLF